MSFDENRYNTRVRNAAAKKISECEKQKYELENKLYNLEKLMGSVDAQRTMTYSSFKQMEKDAQYMNKKLNEVKITRDIWDQVRELCMDIADEMCEEEQNES